MSNNLLLGLIGADLSLSRTPAMHEAEGAAHGLTTIYQRIDTLGRTTPLATLVDAAVSCGFNGLNITHPFKQEVLGLLDAVSPQAAAIGAVNTVVIGEDGSLTGHNTDVTGFGSALRDGLAEARFTRVVQFGAGGAGTAVAHALAAHGVGTLELVDPSPGKAESVAEAVNAAAGREVAVVGSGSIEGADGVVNATPIGMLSHPGTPFDTAALRPEQWVADVIYMPLETQLLADARALGCVTLDGTRMAVGQAVDAFRLFTGLEPDVERMRAAFRATE